MPSKLEQLQQQYRRHLLQEKEEKMIKIHTESQQKALSKVARFNNGSTSVPTANSKPPAITSHHSPVKKGSPGVDRSRPLPPISKENVLSNIRSSPFSAPTDNNISKISGANSSRSKSVDLLEFPRQPPPARLGAQRGNQENDYQNGCTKVSESSHQFEVSHHVSETIKVSKQLEVKTSRTTESNPAQLSESKFIDPKPTQAERKPNADSLTKLKQAELQRLRAKTREVSPSPRHNGFSSDTVNKSSNASTPLRKHAAKPTTTTPLRSRPSFQNATAASSRKTAAPVSKPPGRGARAVAPAVVGRKPPGPGQEQCRICGRNFNVDRIEKHATICAKAAQKKVKIFDATKMRVKGTEAEQFVKKGTVQKVEPKAKQSNWRKKHNEFIEAIRQAKIVQQHLAKGGKVSDLPPPPPSDTSDYVQCPHCKRRFNGGVAERHIPKCKNILSNKNPTPKRK